MIRLKSWSSCTDVPFCSAVIWQSSNRVIHHSTIVPSGGLLSWSDTKKRRIPYVIEDFDWQFNPSIKRKQVYDLATGRFIREARDCLWLGPPGTGKSHLCQALGYQAIKLGFVVLYRSIFDVVRDFLDDETFAGSGPVLTKYLKPDLLIIDDMGIKQLPKRSGECLFEIILRRYETKSTMMTSNRPLEDWGKLLGDVPAATAILDRFLHHAEIITITGRSYRLKDKATKDADKPKEQTKDEPDKDSKR